MNLCCIGGVKNIAINSAVYITEKMEFFRKEKFVESILTLLDCLKEKRFSALGKINIIKLV